MPVTEVGFCETKDCGKFVSSACPLPFQALNSMRHNLQLTVARPEICSDAADVTRHTSAQPSVRRYKMQDACTFYSVQPLLSSPLCNTNNILDTQAYWPFHRMSCHKNEFADAVEEAEPKFAGWMRSHGKLAVLKDDEIERLERAGAATMGVSRAEVMDSMYNRLEPKPKGDMMSCRSPVALAGLQLRFQSRSTAPCWDAGRAEPCLSSTPVAVNTIETFVSGSVLPACDPTPISQKMHLMCVLHA